MCLGKSEDSKKLLKGQVVADGLYTLTDLTSTPRPLVQPSSHTNKQSTSSSPIILTSVTKEHYPNSCSANTYSLWHHRLGHANSRILSIVMNLCNVKFPNKDTFKCAILVILESPIDYVHLCPQPHTPHLSNFFTPIYGDLPLYHLVMVTHTT